MVKGKPGDGAKGLRSHHVVVDEAATSARSRPAGTVRWEPEVYDAAISASALTGSSFNGLINRAVANYLATPEFNAELDEAQQRARAAIDKLAGGT